VNPIEAVDTSNHSAVMRIWTILKIFGILHVGWLFPYDSPSACQSCITNETLNDAQISSESLLQTTDMKLLRNNEKIFQILQRRSRDQESGMPSLTFILTYTNANASATIGPVLTGVGRPLVSKAIASAFLLPEPGDLSYTKSTNLLHIWKKNNSRSFPPF
jgi:hypothetical protein